MKKATKAELTRHRILSAALECFAERGFEATTMRAIADAAGMATGAAYYYFPNKRSLVLAYYEDTLEAATASVEPIREQHATLAARLEAYARAHLNHLASQREALRGLLPAAFESESSASPFGADSAPVREASIEHMARLLEGSDVPVTADLANQFPRLLWLAWMALLALWLTDDTPKQQRTEAMLSHGIPMMTGALQVLCSPFGAGPRAQLVQLLDAMGGNG